MKQVYRRRYESRRRSSRTKLHYKQKIKYGERRYSIWRMEFLHPAMRHDHDIDFARWLHPAIWHVVLGSWQWIHQVAAPSNVIMLCRDDMPLNSPKRPPHWNSTSGFNVAAIGMSFCTNLRNFIQIVPPSAEINDVMSIFKMADLCNLGIYRSNNGFFQFFEKPMYDFL